MLHFLAQTTAPSTSTADEVLSPYIYVFYIAFLVAWVFTPIMRRVAVHYGVVDQPDIRKMHTRPVAYLGGVAVFLGWICGLAISQLLMVHRGAEGLRHVVIQPGIIVGASIIIALGLWDDLRSIRPWIKIGGQIAAACTLLASGIGLGITDKFLKPVFQRIDIFLGWSMSPELYHGLVLFSSAALVIAIVVFCCNATNLMDGLDGLCGGVTAIIAGGFVLLATHLAMIGGGPDVNSDGLRVVLALALLGGVLGFVPYNFNPASIFMGDTGSMFLGFSCALMILFMGEVASKWLLAAMVMFALPVLDTSLAFARRWVNRRPLFSPDKHHFHHQLVARGLTVRKAVVLSYGLSIFFVICGAAIVFMRTRFVVAFYLVLFCSIIVAAYKMGMVHERPVVVTRKPIGESDVAQPAPAIEPSAVLEVRQSGAATTSAATMPGAWNEPGSTPVRQEPA